MKKQKKHQILGGELIGTTRPLNSNGQRNWVTRHRLQDCEDYETGRG